MTPSFAYQNTGNQNQFLSDPYSWGVQVPNTDFGNVNMLDSSLGFDTSGLGSTTNIGSSIAPQQQSIWSNPSTWSAGANAVSSLGQTYLGFQTLDLAKDQLAFQKEAFWKQYKMQQEDRANSAARAKASATGVSQF